MTVLLSLPISVLSQYRHMRDLAPLSIIASVLLVCALSIIGFVCIKKLSRHGEPVNMPIFESSKIILFLGKVILVAYLLFFLVLVTLTLSLIFACYYCVNMWVVSTVYAFEGIGIILPIECSMQHPNYFSQILAVSMTIVTLIYIAFGEIVLMAFGSIDDAGITKYLVTVGSVPASLAAIISVLVSSAVLLSYPLQLYPALQVLEIYFNLAVDDEERERSISPLGTSTAYHDGCVSKYIHPFVNKMRNTLVFFNVLKSSVSSDTSDGIVMYDSPEFKRKRKPTRVKPGQIIGNDHVTYLSPTESVKYKY